LNQDFSGALGLSMNFDANVINVEAPNMLSSKNTNKVFLAGAEKFLSNEPVAYVTLKTDSKYLTLSNVSVNDEEQVSRKYSLNNEEVTSLSVSTITNPVEKNNANFVVNIPEAGEYTLAIYDVLGNQVAVVASGNFQIGSQVINFNANALNTGAYFYKLVGQNGIATGKMIVK
jgi:hypothetical protein